MKKLLLASVALLLAAPAGSPSMQSRADHRAGAHRRRNEGAASAARAAASPPRWPSKRAIEANRTCLGNTYKTTAMITDCGRRADRDDLQ